MMRQLAAAANPDAYSRDLWENSDQICHSHLKCMIAMNAYDTRLLEWKNFAQHHPRYWPHAQIREEGQSNEHIQRKMIICGGCMIGCTFAETRQTGRQIVESINACACDCKQHVLREFYKMNWIFIDLLNAMQQLNTPAIDVMNIFRFPSSRTTLTRIMFDRMPIRPRMDWNHMENRRN